MHRDPWTNPDSQSEQAIKAMATRLEDRAKNTAFMGMIGRYAELLPSSQGMTILDLGCGTGVVARQLAADLDSSSVIHGADVSFSLLEEAKRLDSGERVRWNKVSGDVLPYPDGTFDGIVMHTLLSHVPDPLPILREARRVLKSNGKLIVFDADHAGTTYGQKDYQKGRRIDALLTSAIARHPDICRQMPCYLKEAGFQLDRHFADVISECGKGDYWLSSVKAFIAFLPTLGALSQDECQEWEESMLRSQDDGTFFASGTFFTFVASVDGSESLTTPETVTP